MTQRLLAAFVGLAVLLPAIVFGGPWAVVAIVAVAAAVCVAEYAAMAFPQAPVPNGIFVGAGFGAVFASAVWAGPETAFPVLALTGLAALLFVTLRPGETLDGAADRTGRLVLGVTWLSFLAFLPLIRDREQGLAWIFLVLAVSWLGDTGGYFAGRFFGRHALYPKVSPKKTWEGAFGGITLATAGAFGVRAAGLTDLSVVDCLILGPLLCVAGILGDLAESMLKRAFQVKDSGWIMPGHGGLLDRIDSVLFVAPVLYAWITWVEG